VTPVATARPTYREAFAQLNSSRLQKTTRGLPAYLRYVNRPLGRRVAAQAAAMGLTPNQLTAIGSALTLTGILGVALVRPSLALGAVVAVLLAVGFVLDSADGPLARLQGGGSPSGEWLDHVADAGKHCLLHAAVLVAWFRWFDVRPELLLLPVVFLVAEVMFFFTAMLTEALKKQHGAGPVPGAQGSALRSLVLLPTDYGALLVAFLLWGLPDAFVVVYALLAAAVVGHLVLVMPKWYADVRALGRPA
jgi:phosphatidylglycerophosphate synthase